MTKIIKYDAEARKKLLSGVQAISKAVKITLGPSGRNVIIRQKGDKAPFATKDGVTVANNFTLEDLVEQQAVEAIHQITNSTDENAGDGTTTATVLAEAIFINGCNMLDSDPSINFIDLKRGIDRGTIDVIEKLKELSVDCDSDQKLKEVALISSNNDTNIADIVVKAYKVAGQQGVVNIKRSRTYDTHMTSVEGVNLPTGYASIYFNTDIGNEIVELENAYMYVTNQKISSVTDNLNYLLKSCSHRQEALLIICKDIDPSVLSMLVESKAGGQLKVCVCKAPGFGEEQNEMLRDLSVMYKGHVFLENEGIDFNEISVEVTNNDYPKDDIAYLNMFPRVSNIIVTKNNLGLKGPVKYNEKKFPNGSTEAELLTIENDKEQRANKLREQIKEKTNSYERGILQSRISRLMDGIAYINIGAVTDIDFIEKQHRIQDALYAVKSASEEGIIAGGGSSLYFISYNLTELNAEWSESFKKGYNIVLDAIRNPMLTILENVGIDIINDQAKDIAYNYNTGFNARTGVIHKDLISEGIIDPTKVTRIALENAASVAGMLLTSDCVIIDQEAYSKKKEY